MTPPPENSPTTYRFMGETRVDSRDIGDSSIPGVRFLRERAAAAAVTAASEARHLAGVAESRRHVSPPMRGARDPHGGGAGGGPWISCRGVVLLLTVAVSCAFWAFVASLVFE